jgi:hypothetical protein
MSQIAEKWAHILCNQSMHTRFIHV